MNEFTEKECRTRVEMLSPQLLLVLRRLAGGAATKDIASELNLTLGTVYVYRERIYSRLGVNNIATATRIATLAKII